MADASHADDVPTISTLVQRRLDRGDSARALAQRAEKAGFPIRHQTLSKLASGPPRQWPEPSTMRALAYVLDTSERQVLLAFGRSFGMHVETVDAADLIPPEFDRLPAGVQDAIFSLVRNVAIALSDDRRSEVPRVPQTTLAKPNTIVGPKITHPDQSFDDRDANA